MIASFLFMEIEESRIRQAKWHLKNGDTKKKACEILGISYNTTRLNKIIKDMS